MLRMQNGGMMSTSRFLVLGFDLNNHYKKARLDRMFLTRCYISFTHG